MRPHTVIWAAAAARNLSSSGRLRLSPLISTNRAYIQCRRHLNALPIAFNVVRQLSVRAAGLVFAKVYKSEI